MMIVEPDLDAVRTALEQEGRRVTALLRTGRLDAPVPRLDWTAGQLAVHLSVVYRAFSATIRGEQLPAEFTGFLSDGDSGPLPKVLAATNERVVASLAF